MSDSEKSGEPSTGGEVLEGFIGRYGSTADLGLMFTVILDEPNRAKFHKLSVTRGTRVAVAILNEVGEDNV